ncbi:MAG: VCBS repeat-containing protein [Planctomycetales bacterium]|nr:VCBS repeat-containing protein [Planctomycetales bacterium]
MPSRKPLQPRSYDESPKKPRRFFPSLTPVKVLLGLAVAALITLIGCLVPKQDLGEIARLQEKAIGLAENGESAEADEVLAELAKKAPNDVFVLRNLLVVRLNRFKQQDEKAGVASPDLVVQPPLPPEQLAAAAHALLKAQPNDPATHVLASRAARLLHDKQIEIEPPLPEAFESLSRARELAPSDPAILMNMYELSNSSTYRKDDKVKLTGRAALVDAFKAAPNNLAVLIELLRSQLDLRNHSADPAVAETLASAAELLKPLRPIILQKHPGNDLEKFRQDALSAVKLKNWPIAKENVDRIYNLCNPELITRSDRGRVDLVALEYLKHDLDSKYRAPPPTAPTAIQVAFVPATAEQTLPTVKEVKDFKLFDVDLDGRLDLVVLHGFKLSIFRRGAKDETWGNELTVSLPPGMEHVIVGDLDRDVAKLPTGAEAKKEGFLPGDYKASQQYELAFPDFVVYGSGGLALVRNVETSKSVTINKAGLIERKLELVMIEELKVPQKITALLAVDIDHDQDLDVVFATEDTGVHIWRSLGNATFKYMDFGSVSKLPPKSLVFSLMVQVDWDRDLDYDILLCGADESGKSGPFGYLENLRHGQMRWVSFGKSMQELVGSKSLAVGEFDGNISWDLVGAGRQGTNVILTQTPTAGKVNHIHDIKVDTQIASHVGTWDYDNDSYTDLLVWNARQPYVYRGLPRGLFATTELGLPKGLSGGLVALDYGDLDGDGDLDLVLAEPSKLNLFFNDGGNKNNWLEIRLAGYVNGQPIGSNNTALGTTVETFFPGRYTAQVISRQPVHIGLAQAKEASLVRFLFSNGAPQASRFSGGNQRYAERQKLTGSCPFIYTWTGEKFEFFTDCLWAAPIGLQVAEGKMAPSRAWEYLLIPGDRLKEHSGTYDLQITEELWEAGYFDRVQLIAVDHPADFDIYSNEKVGPPDIASKKIHTVRQARRPISAKDPRGRNVLPLLAERDGKFAQLFAKQVWQGLVEEHYLELDLGKLESKPDHLTLFLTGWIFPTNTSINVNLSQTPDLAYPKLPSLWVPDGKGGWKLAQGFMGFPGGKTKTMAVDIDSAVFPPGDYRVRVVTSAEIYWDEAFFTVNEPAAELTETPLELASADLHYRGFSKEVPGERSSPQLFDYSQVNKAAIWAPMQGEFTRYGDVRELLTETDDCLVVLGSGDEMTVRFRAPTKPLPAGWKRDFLLYSVGWDKDCDMNTVYGTHTDPLPYNAMPSYPYPPDRPFPQDGSCNPSGRVSGRLLTPAIFPSRTAGGRFWQGRRQRASPAAASRCR